MALQMPKEAPGLSKARLLRACWSGGKRCALSLLCDTEGRQARGRWGEERGVEGQGAQQWPLSSREGPSVKCVFLQFEKVESGQIGVLLSSHCMSYATEGGWGGRWGEAGGVYEGAGTALIDTPFRKRSKTLSSAEQRHSRSDWLSPWRRPGGGRASSTIRGRDWMLEMDTEWQVSSTGHITRSHKA